MLSLKPTHVVLEFGSEIASQETPLSPEIFRTRLVRFVDRLESAKVEPILRTGFPLALKLGKARKVLQDYNEIIKQIAVERNLRLGDTSLRFRNSELDRLLADNGWVPTFAGHRELAKTVLHAIGYPDLDVPNTLQLSLLPGVITDWKIRQVPKGQNLNGDEVRQLQLNETWKELKLPQPDDKLLRRYADFSHTITYRDRARGFATDLHHDPDHNIQGVAWIDSDQERSVVFNTGATLRQIWLNGKLIFENRHWTGWHAGKERISAVLQAGRNQIVIEAHDSFFLSVTDQQDWPLP